MITHDEAKEKTLYLHGKYDEAYKTLNTYITQQEQFAKDVARYFELDFFHNAPYSFKKKYADENKLMGENFKQSIYRLDKEWLNLSQKLTKGVVK